MSAIASVLRCPTGDEGLLRARSSGELQCSIASHRFGSIAQIPCLFEDPRVELAQWRYQIDDFVRDNATTRDTVLAMLAGSSPHPLTRRRLQRLHACLDEHGRRVQTLLAKAGLHPSKRQEKDPRTRVPGEGNLTAYYHQIHRDWGWGDHESEENAAALSAVIGALDAGHGVSTPRRMLVLGAGACRLPYDLHVHLRPELTLALDINPLPFLVAKEVITGRSVSLFEFPVTPAFGEQVAVDRVLRASKPGVPGFEFAFADATDPPVADGSFELVLTPWFIDQVPKNMVDLFPQIRRVLADDGVWLNHGPLIYHPSHTMLAHRYPAAEVLALVEDAGFAVEFHTSERMLYMQSPAGSQGRTETVLTFRARKKTTGMAPRAGSAPGSRAETGDAWLDDHALPVPTISGASEYEAPHPMFGAVLALVDGRRSVQDIARIMVERHGLPAHAARTGVQACLSEIVRTLREKGRDQAGE